MLGNQNNVGRVMTNLKLTLRTKMFRIVQFKSSELLNNAQLRLVLRSQVNRWMGKVKG